METTQARGALHVPPGEGRSFWLLGELYTAKAVGEDTGGEFAFVEAITLPQAGPPPHIHHREDETFWVLEGEFEFMVGDGTVRAPAGTFVHAPKGSPHTYKNVRTTPDRYVTTIRPAGFEQFFFEVSDPAEDPRAQPPAHGQEVIERIMMAAPRYGLEILSPPEQ
jgi:mannose-6-phosphate isomerase-like protein (cupin superfamily)